MSFLEESEKQPIALAMAQTIDQFIVPCMSVLNEYRGLAINPHAQNRAENLKSDDDYFLIATKMRWSSQKVYDQLLAFLQAQTSSKIFSKSEVAE